MAEGSLTAAQCNTRREKLEALMQTPESGTTPGGIFQGSTPAIAWRDMAYPPHSMGKQRSRRSQHREAKTQETLMLHLQRLPHRVVLTWQRPKRGTAPLRRRRSTRPIMAAMPTQWRPVLQPLGKGTLHPLTPKRPNRPPCDDRGTPDSPEARMYAAQRIGSGRR
ncbi:Hypothetical predicted protein [Pelobates cultripes]|uniref:Uncharacterized protein n=1 Tax=Pelobates cultripes TaxID=61616 RepID=A0AAD1W280_PELCU|nr:Hypothetical predicted protein [Pelobates cultripes]